MHRRVPTGTPLGDPPLIELISSDPVLADTKLIAEAWDCDGLNQVRGPGALQMPACHTACKGSQDAGAVLRPATARPADARLAAGVRCCCCRWAPSHTTAAGASGTATSATPCASLSRCDCLARAEVVGRGMLALVCRRLGLGDLHPWPRRGTPLCQLRRLPFLTCHGLAPLHHGAAGH